MTWHEIRDPADPELDRLAALYALHPLHIEDCRHGDQIAKVEEDDKYVFTVLKPAAMAEDGSLVLGDLDIFLGRDFLITVEEHGCGPVRNVLDHARATAGTARPDQIFYRIMDGVVDSYLPLIDHFNETIDAIEEKVLEQPSPDTLQKIFETKRGLIELRRVLGNSRDVVGHLQRTAGAYISQDMWPFLRDVYDHLARNIDMVEMQRDLLSGSLDIYLSSVANRTNRVMKVLTVLGTVALPALVISSFYGMNVKHLPWADSAAGLAIISGVMLASTCALLALLRYFDWL